MKEEDYWQQKLLSNFKSIHFFFRLSSIVYRSEKKKSQVCIEHEKNKQDKMHFNNSKKKKKMDFEAETS